MVHILHTVTGLTDTVCGPRDVEGVEMLALERRVTVESEVGKVGKISVTFIVASGSENVKLGVENLGIVKLRTDMLGMDDSVVREVTVTVTFGVVTEAGGGGGGGRAIEEVPTTGGGGGGGRRATEEVVKGFGGRGGVGGGGRATVEVLTTGGGGGGGGRATKEVVKGFGGEGGGGGGGRATEEVLTTGGGGGGGWGGRCAEDVLILMLPVETTEGEGMVKVVVFGPAGMLIAEVLIGGGLNEERLLVDKVGTGGKDRELELVEAGMLKVDVSILGTEGDTLLIDKLLELGTRGMLRLDVLTLGTETELLLIDKLLELGTGGMLRLDGLTFGAETDPLLNDTAGGTTLVEGVLREVFAAGVEIWMLLADTPEPEGMTESVLVDAADEEIGAPMTLAAKSTPELTPIDVILFLR